MGADGGGVDAARPRLALAFETAPTYDTIAPAGRIVNGDLDGDGVVDLAVVSGLDRVSVLLGQGDGTFASAVHYTVGRQPGDVDVGDLDGDKDLDLVVGTGAGLAVLLNDGTGRFGTAVVYASSAIDDRVLIVDVDRDGTPDVLGHNAIGAYPSQLVFWKGKGDGTFGTAVASNINVTAPQRGLAVHDYDGDGALDIFFPGVDSASAPTSTLMYRMKGNGDGTFGPTATSMGAMDLLPTVMTKRAHVFDASGVPKIAVVAYCSVFLIDPAGTVPPGPGARMGFCGTPATHDVEAIDMNGDGALDLVFTTDPGPTAAALGMQVALGANDGTFGPPRAWRGDASQTSYLAVADFNGDGRLDVAATGSTFGSVTVFLARAGGFVAPLRLYDRAGGLVGDFDGDGKRDVAFAGEYLSTKLLLARALGGGEFAPLSSVDIGASAWGGAVGDFNEDGLSDVAIVTTTPDVRVFAGARAGGWGAPITSPSVKSNSVFVGDFDEDGHLDLEVLGQNQLLFSRGRGDGSFAPQVTAAYVGTRYFFALADFDRDGHLDVAGDGVFLQGHGDGSFANPVSLAPMWSAAGTSFSYGVRADLDGDGHPELVGRAQPVGSPPFTFIASWSAAGAITATPLAMDYQVLEAGDLDLDGNDELVGYRTQTSSGTGSLLIYEGTGTLSVGPLAAMLGRGSTTANLVDIDDDGKLDLQLGADFIRNISR